MLKYLILLVLIIGCYPPDERNLEGSLISTTDIIPLKGADLPENTFVIIEHPKTYNYIYLVNVKTNLGYTERVLTTKRESNSSVFIQEKRNITTGRLLQYRDRSRIYFVIEVPENSVIRY